MDPFKISLVSAGTSLVSAWISKHLGKMEPQVYTGLTAVVTMVISWSFEQELAALFHKTSVWYLGVAAVLAVTAIALYRSYMHFRVWALFKFRAHKDNDNTSLSIQDMNTLSALGVYIKQNPSYFPTVHTFSQGFHLAQPLYGICDASVTISGQCRLLQALSYPDLQRTHPIDDPCLKGSMKWTLSLIPIEALLGQTMTKVSLPTFTVVIETENGPMSAINAFVSKILQTRKQTILAENIGVTLVPDKNSAGNLYAHTHHLPPLPPLDGEVLTRHEFDSFFHPRRAEILMMLISVQFNKDLLLSKGLSTSLGILAYGPPGCGKSALGFRIARALKRLPISIDLQRVLHLKDAYQILYNPFVSGCNFNPSEVVIMMDEFDEVVTHLHEKEQRFSMPPIHGSGDPASPSSPQYSKPPQSTDSTDMDKLKSTVSSYETLTATLQDQLTINGLLKLLQGPLPDDGSIKVATTNKLDAILEIREAIARPGRLTPLECTYPNKVVVDQMSTHYFGVPFDEDIPHLEGTPTSALTAKAASLIVQYKNDLVAGARAFHDEILEIADRL